MIYLYTTLGIFIWLFLGYLSAILHAYNTKKYKGYSSDWDSLILFISLGIIGLVCNIFRYAVLAFEDKQYVLKRVVEEHINEVAEKIEDKSLFVNKKNSKKPNLPLPHSFFKR